MSISERSQKIIENASLLETEQAYIKLCELEVEAESRLKVIREAKAVILTEITIRSIK